MPNSRRVASPSATAATRRCDALCDRCWRCRRRGAQGPVRKANRANLRALLPAFTLLALASALPAQAPADRRFLDSVVAGAQAARSVAEVPAVSRCDGRDVDVARICTSALLLRRGQLDGQRDLVIAASDAAVRAVLDQGKWPYGWWVLGLVRLQLASDTALSREGPELPVGASNAVGAANAFMQALDFDATFAAAADALALTPEPREGTAALRDRLQALRRARALLSPAALTASAIVERDAGSVDSAIALERRALSTGKVDSGVVLLSLARDLYRTDHPNDGRDALIRGATIATESSREAYRSELSWVATPKELSEWDAVAPGERSLWLTRFWAIRDVAEGRQDGERLIEHYRRIDYAMTHLRIALPETGRQRSLTFSVPGEYAKEQRGLAYALRNPDLCPEAARFANDARSLGADAPSRYYQPVQDLVDDRGMVWIRHGPPTRIKQSVGGETVEIWRYERPEGPLVLQFRAADFEGTSGAAVLVPSLLTISPGVRNQICDIETSLCSMLAVARPLEPGDTLLFPPPTNLVACKGCPPPVDPVTHLPVRRSRFDQSVSALNERCRDPMARVLERQVYAEGNLLNTAAIVRARATGREQIDLATTTDTYHRDFAKAIHPVVEVYGLDRTDGGEPRLVVAFALPGGDLGYVKRDSSSGRVVYPVRMQVIAASERTGVRSSVDTMRQFSTNGPAANGQFLGGLLEVLVPAGQYAVSVVFTQADGHGAIAYLHAVAVPGGNADLNASDIVLGRANSGVHWNSGTADVPLNPLNTYPAGGQAEVYFQLSGLQPGTTYRITFELFRADDDPKRPPRLALSFTEATTQARVEVARTLGLQHLNPGRYRVKLTVSNNGAETSSTAWLTIVK